MISKQRGKIIETVVIMKREKKIINMKTRLRNSTSLFTFFHISSIYSIRPITKTNKSIFEMSRLTLIDLSDSKLLDSLLEYEFNNNVNYCIRQICTSQFVLLILLCTQRQLFIDYEHTNASLLGIVTKSAFVRCSIFGSHFSFLFDCQLVVCHSSCDRIKFRCDMFVWCVKLLIIHRSKSEM